MKGRVGEIGRAGEGTWEGELRRGTEKGNWEGKGREGKGREGKGRTK